MHRLAPFLVSIMAASALLVAHPRRALAGDGWGTLKQKGGVNGWVLYSRPKPGSAFVEYRIVGEVTGSPRLAASAARSLLVEPRHLPSGVRRTILRDDPDVIVSHSRFGLPGPLADRDVVLRVEAYELPTGAMGFRWKNASELGPPPASGVVRMRQSSGGWEFTSTAEGRVVAVGLLHGDVGGYMPAFLVNRMAGDSLITDLDHIRQIVARQPQRAAR